MLPAELPNPGAAERYLDSFRQWRLANPGAMTAIVLAVLLVLALGGVFGAYQVWKQRRHAEFLLACRRQCDAAAVRYQERQELLAGQLADLAGEAVAKNIGQTLQSLPDDPVARLAGYRELDLRLEKLARNALAPIPERASEAEIYRISDRTRGLLASPLGAWLSPAERKTLMQKLTALENLAFPRGMKLRPGQDFRQDTSFRGKFVYVPAGVFRRKNGRLIRIPYGFWCADSELRADRFLPAMGWMNGAERPGMPAAKFTWNDLLDYCRGLTVGFQQCGEIPPGYIVRPLTAAEWQWACRGAWSGPGQATAFLRNNSGGRLHPVCSGEPNSLGLYDMIGNIAEMIIPDSGLDDGHRVAFCGGSYEIPAKKIDPEKCSNYLKYQWLPPNIGTRIAIVPGSMDFFERAWWRTGPRETVFHGRHYELLVTNDHIMSQKSGQDLCRLLGGRLLVPESDEQLKTLREAFFEVGSFPVVIGGGLKNGVWVKPDGTPYRGVTLPELPKHPQWLLAFHRSRIECERMTHGCGLVCEWDEAEYRARTDRDRILRSGAFLHRFQIGPTEYLLVPCPVHSHMARRIAQLLGAKLAQPRSEAVRDRFRRELRPWKKLPVMLGGHRKYGQWLLDDGSVLDLELSLSGSIFSESLNMASPGLLGGDFCALQRAQAFLLELPRE
ncbi:MAG: SUMF1/EgtB/PvdO family nonheme iron enzyme [Lentisphaeria bacterium]|nr:SUMF1/EgtB/PvdO family nonheme iron enzyme [Lentisphaeria bacterium]